MTHLSELADRVSDKNMALPSDRAGRASPEPASSLGHSATIPSAWPNFMQRLEAFAEDYCRVKPSLGMVGAMAWVLGCEIDFQLIPRNASGIETEGQDAQRLGAEPESPTGNAGDAEPQSRDTA